MIHRIHTGEELTQDYTVYGSADCHNFNEVLYPGRPPQLRGVPRRATVRTCRSPPAPTRSSPPRDYFSPQGPGTAACLGCHDNEDAAAHAYLNTTTFPGSTKPSEACGDVPRRQLRVERRRRSTRGS